MRISDSLVIKLLTNSKEVSDEQIEKLKKHEAADKKALQYLAVKEGLLSEEELTKLYANEIDVPFVDLDVKSIDPEHLGLLPERVAKKYKAVVFNVDGEGTYHIAMEDPEDVQSVIYLRKMLGNRLKLFITSEASIKKALDKMKPVKGSSAKKMETPEDQKLDASEEDIAKTINELVNKGIKVGATDIHIEPRQDVIVVRYRIDGSLSEQHKLPLSMLSGLVDQIKLIGGLSNSEFKIPQNGKFKFESGDQTRTIDVATMPVLDGEKVVMRIVNESGEVHSFSELGLWGKNLKNLNKLIAKPQGLVLACGPIGSGRSATLFSILNKLQSPSVNISTIEDPIEQRMEGINQSSVNLAGGVTFAVGLKAILQHDPNVILVGELQDIETAELAVRAASKGHLVLTTMFTPNAGSAIKRLEDMGVEAHQTAANLNGVVSQRLVRRLCEECSTSFTPTSSQLKQIKEAFELQGSLKTIQVLEKEALSEGLVTDKTKQMSSSAYTLNKLWEASADGCEECNYSGFSGRIGLFEVLLNSEGITKLIASGKNGASLEKNAEEDGMVSMKVDGLIKVLRGITSIEEVLRATA